jgi:23S rRNA pseudouridine2604 synthase
MPDTQRKTLGLPVRADGERRVADPHRKPVRGMASLGSDKRRERRVEAEADAAQPVSADKTDWRKKSQGKQSKRHGGPPSATPTRPEQPTQSLGGKTVDLPPDEHGGSVPEPEKPAGVRVSKLMAERGLCSRREADEFIVRGWVYVDGERVAELGTRADPSVKITLDAQARAVQQRQMTILLHKPVGYVSGQPEPGCQPAIVLIRPENQRRSPDTPIFHASHLKGLAVAGRLDVDSTGLLVLTQDGRVAKRLIGENSKVDKEYLVRVTGQLADNGLALLNHGLSLDGKPLKPAQVEWLNDDQLRFVLNEGRKRQIRRMCEQVGLRVTGLKRVRIGAVRLGDLPPGQWRYLRENETF